MDLHTPVSVIGPDEKLAQKLVEALVAEGVDARACAKAGERVGSVILLGPETGEPAESAWSAIQALRAARADSVGQAILLDVLSKPKPGRTKLSIGLSGLAKTAAREWPDMTLASLTMQAGGAKAMARAILSLDMGQGAEFAWDGKRLVRPVLGDLDSAGRVGSVSPKTWLVTGGARGVTADCVVELARRTGGHFVLLGRTQPVDWPEGIERTRNVLDLRRSLVDAHRERGHAVTPKAISKQANHLLASDEIARTLSSLKQAGGSGDYVVCDVSNRQSVDELMRWIDRQDLKIDGLVHGAGVVSDRRLDQKTRRDVEVVFTPKLTGLQTLLDVLDPAQLSHVGLFSSAAARFGNVGQADYAMANTALNNWARQLKAGQPSTRVCAFNWGPWEGGMVDEALARQFKARGIQLIGRQAGAKLFADVMLGGGDTPVEILVGDPWEAGQ